MVRARSEVDLLHDRQENHDLMDGCICTFVQRTEDTASFSVLRTGDKEPGRRTRLQTGAVEGRHFVRVHLATRILASPFMANMSSG
jgi:hypothetical protein